MTTKSPSTDGPNGRDGRGKFARGNKLGRGSPLAAKAAKLRAALFRAVSERDVESIAKALAREAKAGDVQAARIVLGYLIGEPLPHDVLAELEEMRGKLAEIEQWQKASSETR